MPEPHSPEGLILPAPQGYSSQILPSAESLQPFVSDPYAVPLPVRDPRAELRHDSPEHPSQTELELRLGKFRGNERSRLRSASQGAIPVLTERGILISDATRLGVVNAHHILPDHALRTIKKFVARGLIGSEQIVPLFQQLTNVHPEMLRLLLPHFLAYPNALLNGIYITDKDHDIITYGRNSQYPPDYEHIWDLLKEDGVLMHQQNDWHFKNELAVYGYPNWVNQYDNSFVLLQILFLKQYIGNPGSKDRRQAYERYLLDKELPGQQAGLIDAAYEVVRNTPELRKEFIELLSLMPEWFTHSIRVLES